MVEFEGTVDEMRDRIAAGMWEMFRAASESEASLPTWEELKLATDTRRKMWREGALRRAGAILTGVKNKIR